MSSPRTLAQFTLAGCACALTLVGCIPIPYPIYKTLQPEASVLVVDKKGKQIAGAQVTLIAKAHPSPFEQGRETKISDTQGVARFDRRQEWKTEVIFIHGSLEYYWNWCITHKGYTSFESGRGGEKFEPNMTVRLQPGTSTPCEPPETKRR